MDKDLCPTFYPLSFPKICPAWYGFYPFFAILAPWQLKLTELAR
jgi:hypothetical protein